MAHRSSTSDSRTLAFHIEAVTYSFAFNVLLLMFIGRSYLESLRGNTSVAGWAAALLASVANFAMLALAPALLSTPFLFFRRRWLTLTVLPLLYGLLSVFIYADSIIYILWHFHFNGMVWNLLTTPGAGDTVTAGRGTVTYTVAAICAILAIEFAFAWWVFPRLRVAAKRFRTGRAFATFWAVVALLLIADKVTFSIGDLRDNMEVMRLRNVLPLYQPVTFKRFASRVLGVSTVPRKQLKVRLGGSLNYPKAPIRFRPGSPRPNVVVIAIEGARWDMLTPQVMPNLYYWGESQLVFDDNYSSGNTTRYGIFGLIYGLDGSYWQSALAEHVGPVMIHTLKQLGYSFRILSCTDLNFPEFRGTAFIDVLDAITDKWDCRRVERDRLMTDRFIEFVNEKRTPFFAFMFYDASHQPYNFPREHAVFDIGNATGQINYIKLAQEGGDLHFIENRYRNSLHYVDAQIDRALQTLAERGLMDNTLVFIVGDHGEAFGELGFFGHDSTFDRYETKTLCLAHVPGQKPERLQRMTSHEDVSATVLTYMGAENPLGDYTQGLPLTGKATRPFVFISSWANAAIVDSNTITAFGLEAYNADITILNTNNVPLPNQRAALAAHQNELVAAMEQMRQFKK
ncbi:MAG TPA: sulfatase-like hydrolase/transferase [Verrucomicrobiae bacterium]|nr:sulfatase-like hydrolase/transferase [Verrucomicrobiae bacterium]